MTAIYFPCASDMQSAVSVANQRAVGRMHLRDQDIQGTVCTDTGKTVSRADALTPKIMPQGAPATCAASPDDDTCVICAKASCCADYQACSLDTNCSCLVGCLAQGGSVAACTSTSGCGAPTSVSASATACLDAACPSQCESPGGMGSGMCPMATGSGGGGAGGGLAACGAAGAACLDDTGCCAPLHCALNACD